MRLVADEGVDRQIVARLPCPALARAAAGGSCGPGGSSLAEWEPRIGSYAYDPWLVPLGEKAGVLFGMEMTEK